MKNELEFVYLPVDMSDEEREERMHKAYAVLFHRALIDYQKLTKKNHESK